jgi:predicted small secreted protein
MFIAPTAFIVISNTYFRYHYYMYAFPTVIMLIEMIDGKDKIVEHIKEKKFPYLLSIVALVVCSYLLLMNFNEKYSIISSAILLCVFVSYIFLFLYGRVTLKHLIITFLSLPTLWYISYCSIISPRVHNNIESEKMYRTLNKETLDQLEISPSSKILYLDDGGTPYVLGNESVCRYLYPLPIERPTPKEKQLKCYFNTLNDCINYKGEWIFYAEEWMEECMYNNPQIAQKLENEYYDTGLKLYCISCPPLHLGKKEIASFVYAGGISIYKKNQ